MDAGRYDLTDMLLFKLPTLKLNVYRMVEIIYKEAGIYSYWVILLRKLYNSIRTLILNTSYSKLLLLSSILTLSNTY